MPRCIKRESAKEREWRERVARTVAAEEPTRAWVVEGMLRRGEVRTLMGMPKTGKTVLAARLAAAVSRGEAFGRAKTWRTNVLYLAAEESPLEWEFGVGPLLPLTDRWFRVAFASPRLDLEEEAFMFRMAVEYGGVGMVVVDPLQAVAVDVRAAIVGLSRLAREKDVAVLVVHHGERRGRSFLHLPEFRCLAQPLGG